MKNKTERKNEIIRASIGLMYLKGYNGTSVKDITDAAGIPKGSFYNYFKDKEQYAVDALLYYQSDMSNEKMQLLTNKDLKPLERIKEFFKYGIKNLIEKELKYGCFLGNLTQEMGDVSEVISKTSAKINNEIVLMIYKNLVEAHENKELKKEVDLKVLASFIISSWQGTLVRMKMSADKSVLDDFYTMLNEELLK
jgi:TetR/AcrR family transcriptional repressor of nem operon